MLKNNNQLIKCLLIGYGNIGKIHSKYFNKNKIMWDWFDPYSSKNSKNRITQINYESVKVYTHIFICTPESTHYDIYKNLRKEIKYKGPIFVEKPAVLRIKDFDIFDDENIMVGMVERFNPAIICLKDNIDKEKIVNIDFERCCDVKIENMKAYVSIIEDLGIHDLDLLCYLLSKENLDNIKLHNFLSPKVRTASIILEDIKSNSIFRFIWSHETYFKERKIIVRQSDCTYVADLIEQSVKKYQRDSIKNLYVEKGSSIENEQKYFFDNTGYFCSKNSHDLLIKCKIN